MIGILVFKTRFGIPKGIVVYKANTSNYEILKYYECSYVKYYSKNTFQYQMQRRTELSEK